MWGIVVLVVVDLGRGKGAWLPVPPDFFWKVRLSALRHALQQYCSMKEVGKGAMHGLQIGVIGHRKGQLHTWIVCQGGQVMGLVGWLFSFITVTAPLLCWAGSNSLVLGEQAREECQVCLYC